MKNSQGIEVRYLRWTADGPELDPIAELLTELGEGLGVLREVGLDAAGKVVYKYPWAGYPSSFRGWFGSLVEASKPQTDMDLARFDALWGQEIPTELRGRPPGLPPFWTVIREAMIPAAWRRRR